jgi:hypothetical protein
MSYRTMYDAAYPSGIPAGAQCVAGYIGGDAYNVWTLWPDAPYRLPIWVQSDPTTSDGPALVSRARSLGLPVGCTIALDTETAIAPDFFEDAIASLKGAGFRSLTYGSIDSVFQNPCDLGRWVADPTGVPHMYPGPQVLATQYLFAGSYDASLIDTSVPLWGMDLTPPPPPSSGVEDVYSYDLEPQSFRSRGFPAGSQKAVNLFCDNTYLGASSPMVRVALHSASKGFYSEETYASSSKRTVISFTEPDTDGISLARQDTTQVWVSYDFS